MRFVSKKQNGFRVFAVTAPTPSRSVSKPPRRSQGLLGFAVERIDPQAEDERYFMPGISRCSPR